MCYGFVGDFFFMKTSVIMTRKLGDYIIPQRTGDSFYNASSFLEQWNANPCNPRREMSKFLEMTTTKDFLEALKQELIEVGGFPLNRGKLDTQLIKTKSVKTKKGGRPRKEYWVNPYVFTKIMMWAAPKFEARVVMWLTDGLIPTRHEAGDNFKLLTASASRFVDVDYTQIAKGLNYIVFNKHYNGIRNHATEDELKELRSLEEKLAFLIDMGYVRNHDELMNALRKMYNDKYQKF